MKWWKIWTCLIVLLAFSLAGCPKETELGGPGANDGEAVDSEKTFSLSLPDGTNVAQGEDQEATISLNPGDEFMEDVTVTVESPAGVTFKPSELKLTKDQPDGKLMIRADATAPAGDHMVKVTGKPATGEAVNSTFTVTVEADDADTANEVPADDVTPPATDGDLPPADGTAPPAGDAPVEEPATSGAGT